MFSVIKLDGRTVEFDTSKINRAIEKAFEAMEHASEKIDEMLEKFICYNRWITDILADSLEQWVLHSFLKITSRVRRAFCFNPHSSIWMETDLCIQVKLLTTSFLEHSYAYREAWLLRTQDRGIDDNSDSDIVNINFAATL